jgi:hypothetical protein
VQRTSDARYGDSVVALTAGFRRHSGLPSQFVVQGADDEYVLLLACAGAALGMGRVHLVPHGTLSHFSSGTEPGNGRNWPSFVEYFAEALERGADGGPT